MGTFLGFAALALLGVVSLGALLVRLSSMEARIVALNDAQEARVIEAVGGVGTAVTGAADRVAALIAAQNIDDPELETAIGDLRAIGEQAAAIAANPADPPVG